jgi:hypothetical protein
MKIFIKDYHPIYTMAKSIGEDVKHWKQIELFFTKNKCGNAHEIAKSIDAHWMTTTKELQKLEEIGRIHKEGNVYFLNGVNEWQKQVKLNSNHTLFIDTMRSPFGENFIRIKETKKQGGQWTSVGNIIITKDKIKEVRDFLDTVSKNLESIT